MTKQQRLQLDAILRQGQIDLAADVPTLRAGFEAVMAQVPVGADIQQKPTTIGGVDGLEVSAEGAAVENAILYFHGGVYVIGSAATSVPLVAELARRTGTRCITLNYRLAPENPHPAAVDDARAAYKGLVDQGINPGRIALAGDSAGGGLAVAAMIGLRDEGVPLPAGALLMSPYADLTLSGDSIVEKQALDPTLTPDGLRIRVPSYVGNSDPADPLISPVFGDLAGLPPLLIQVGSNEILLSDALRLAERAIADDVPVILDVTPGVPHVFQAFAAALDEADAALNRAASFLNAQFPAE